MLAAVKHTIEATAAGISHVGKATLALLLTLSLLAMVSPGMHRMLALAPGLIGPPQMHIWILLTGGFVETNPLILVMDMVAAAMAAGLLEPLWGPIEYAKFILVVSITTCFAASIHYIFLYAASQNVNFIFSAFGGFWGMLAGYLVALKQAFPQKRLTIGLVGLSLDVRLAPLIFVTAVISLHLTGFVGGSAPILAAHGLLMSWIYLRFYQQKGNNSRGDASEAFAFADFFPATLQPIVIVVSGHTFKCMTRIGVCNEKPQQYDLSAPSSIKISLPGQDEADADRRRQLALRDLETRTSLGSAPSTPRGPAGGALPAEAAATAPLNNATAATD